MSAKQVYFPEEVMVIIKAYLLLPREAYEARLEWWNYYATLPYVNLRKMVFDDIRYEQIIYGTPIQALPDTHFKALKMLYSIIDTKYDHVSKNGIRGGWFLQYGRYCHNSNCKYEYEYEDEGSEEGYKKDDLVVKLMPYNNYEQIGVERFQEQLICKKCVEDREHMTDCGRCEALFECAELTYVKYDEDDYEYNNNYFCKDCVGRVGCEDWGYENFNYEI